jgi:hypothetical protein
VSGLAVGEDAPVAMSRAANSVVMPMADIIVGDSFQITQSHGQHRLRPAQRLDLRLLVHGQHHGVIRMVQAQAHNVAHLLHKESSGIDKGFTAMRL